MTMDKGDQKIVQYLEEAHASETALVSVLQSQAAMTPRGSYRDAVEQHLGETREHARRIEQRLGELGHGRNPVQVVLGFTETVIGQTLALTKTPFDLLRGTGGEEKVLKNAKDASATEALEIATYIALERLAHELGDEETADLAASIREDEERMLQRVLSEIPRLAGAVVGAEVEGNGSYDVTKTGAADAARKAVDSGEKAARRTAKAGEKAARQTAQAGEQAARSAESSARGAARQTAQAGEQAARSAESSARGAARQTAQAGEQAARSAESSARSTARQTRKVPGVARAEGEVKGAAASEQDLPIANYDSLNALEIVPKLRELSQTDLGKVDAYERKNENRATVRQRIEALRGQEPWPGYDELTVTEIESVLGEGDGQRAKQVIAYERAHKNRSGVINAAERETANA
jgi:ferritin-like metal-binding protein YciE